MVQPEVIEATASYNDYTAEIDDNSRAKDL